MATIRDLTTELTAPASTDRLAASDTSAAAGSQDKYIELGDMGLPNLANTWTAVQTFSGGTAVNGFFNLASGGGLTIASGAITVTHSLHFVDTQGGASSDDLDTINGGASGDILILRLVTQTRVVTVKDGTGNIRLEGDRVLNTGDDVLVLLRGASTWLEISFANNS